MSGTSEEIEPIAYWRHQWHVLDDRRRKALAYLDSLTDSPLKANVMRMLEDEE